MSSIDYGDEISPADFAASVLADLQGMDADTAEAPAEVATDSGATEDTAEAPEVERDASGRLRGEDGKFLPEAEVTEDDADEQAEEDAAAAAEEALNDEEPNDWVLEVDDEETAERVSKVLEKYDGDPAKALVALAEAQSLIGRKGAEASQASAEATALRQELAELRATQQQVLQRLSQPQVPLVPITPELIEENPQFAAEQAVAQDNPRALEAAIASWRSIDGVAPELFLKNLVLQAELEAAKSTAPAPAPETTDSDVDAEVQKVLAKHPDLEQHLPAIGKAADENPLLKRAMETGTPAERAQALEALTVIAKASTGADTSRDAMRRVQVRVKQDADEARKNARVVSASRGTAAVASQPTRVDQFLEAFDARLGINVEDF